MEIKCVLQLSITDDNNDIIIHAPQLREFNN